MEFKYMSAFFGTKNFRSHALFSQYTFAADHWKIKFETSQGIYDRYFNPNLPKSKDPERMSLCKIPQRRQYNKTSATF